MTNAEKFKEIFGFDVDTDGEINLCIGIKCYKCPFFNGCNVWACKGFWNEEYQKEYKYD